ATMRDPGLAEVHWDERVEVRAIHQASCSGRVLPRRLQAEQCRARKAPIERARAVVRRPATGCEVRLSERLDAEPRPGRNARAGEETPASQTVQRVAEVDRLLRQVRNERQHLGG